MKKLSFCTVSFCRIAIFYPMGFVFLITTMLGCSSATGKQEEKQTDMPTAETTSLSSPIDGNWQLVWGTDNGVVRKPGNPIQFKTFNDGYFALFAHDAAGKLAYAGYGKYTLEGNTYKETFIWHNNPENIGAMDWQEYTLNGDTLYFKGFDKVIVQGKERTADFPKIEEKRVRAK